MPPAILRISYPTVFSRPLTWILSSLSQTLSRVIFTNIQICFNMSQLEGGKKHATQITDPPSCLSALFNRLHRWPLPFHVHSHFGPSNHISAHLSINTALLKVVNDLYFAEGNGLFFVLFWHPHSLWWIARSIILGFYIFKIPAFFLLAWRLFYVSFFLI